MASFFIGGVYTNLMCCVFAVLRTEGDELLHSDVRRVPRPRRARSNDLVARARPPHRAAQVPQHRHADQAAVQVKIIPNKINQFVQARS